MDKDGGLNGLITFKDLQAATQHPNAVRDYKGQLLWEALRSGDSFREQSIGGVCDVLVIDTAHILKVY